ncbi:MAG: aldo/keto reductase [Paucibacter sp.]|nr:aldo/keto reductase [Roseateles sp.]
MNSSQYPLHKWLPQASSLVYGCMGLGGTWDHTPVGEVDISRAEAAVEAALAIGITLFDHADIYTLGKAESAFGALLARRGSLRQQILIQSKCAIRFEDGAGPKRYDLSAQHVEASVEGSLKRLGIDGLDLLLLHRPDPLVELEELAEVLARMKSAGKYLHLGVSNMHAGQIAWLAQALNQPLVANQIEFSLGHLDLLEAGTCFNDLQARKNPAAMAWAGTLEHCVQHGIQLQSWGALARGRFSGDNPRHAADAPARAMVSDMAERYGVSREGLVLAWLMRHPACIQPVIGTSDPRRILACGDAATISLRREDWFSLYEAARGQPLP